MFMYIHTYIHIYIYIYIYLYIYINVSHHKNFKTLYFPFYVLGHCPFLKIILIHTCMNAWIIIYSYTKILFLYIDIYIHEYIYHACIITSYMLVYIYIYIYIYACIHTCMQLFLLSIVSVRNPLHSLNLIGKSSGLLFVMFNYGN